MAGICTTFAGFIACQGVIFGIGLGCVSLSRSSLPLDTDKCSVLYPFNPFSPSGLTENYPSPLYVQFNAHLYRADIQGIGAAGSGLGGLVLSNITRVTLEKYGVKWSLIINGLISLVCLVPTVLLLKSRHKKVGSRVASFQLKWIVHPGYIFVLLWGFFSRMFSYSNSLHLSGCPLFSDRPIRLALGGQADTQFSCTLSPCTRWLHSQHTA
jgi:hypothetical protein